MIAGVVLGALALLWEFAVPPEIKEKIYKGIEDFFKEIKDVFSDLFDVGEGSIFTKIIRGVLKIVYLPFTMVRVWLSLILSEGMKRNINEGVRNLADTMVNGLIGVINNIIRFVTDLIPTEILGFKVPGADTLKNFQLGAVDFSDFNLMMGTDSSVGGVSAAEHAGRDMQLTGFGNVFVG